MTQQNKPAANSSAHFSEVSENQGSEKVKAKESVQEKIKIASKIDFKSKNKPKTNVKNKKSEKSEKKAKTTKAKTSSVKKYSIETLQDAFIHELSDMRSAEQQLLKALPKMAKAATNPDLIDAFETHLKETEDQIRMIDEAVESCQIKLKNEKCNAMEGLVEESREIIEEVASGEVLDVMLIAAAQKVEHYEIASYGCLVSVAKQLGFTEAAELLAQILEQEKWTDRKLNQIAQGGINQDAFMQDSTKGSSTMSQYEREDNRNSGQRTPQRDEDGHFMSNDDRGYGRGSRSNYQDNEQSSSGSGRNYDDYRYGRSNEGGNYDDQDNYSSQGQYNDSDRSSGSRGGNYNSDYSRSEGQYQGGRQNGQGGQSRSSSRDDYYDSNNGGFSSRSGNGRSQGQSQGQGWFGDSEGHARAGSHSHDNDRSRGGRSSSSGSNTRYDNDDDRYNSQSRNSGSSSSRSGGGRSQGGQGQGWFGDSEGHARAGSHSHDNDRSRSSR